MSAATENMRNNQEQADRDGIMVKVSRQAVDETLAEYDAMLDALKIAENVIERNFPNGSALISVRAAIAKAEAT